MKGVAISLLVIMSFFSLNAYEILGSPSYDVTDREGAIPPEFGKKGEVLLCMVKGSKGYDKVIKKHAVKRYQGPTEFISEMEVNNTEYDDKDKYRYFLYSKLTENRREVPNVNKKNAAEPAMVTQVTSSYQFFVLDRKKM